MNDIHRALCMVGSFIVFLTDSHFLLIETIRPRFAMVFFGCVRLLVARRKVLVIGVFQSSLDPGW